MLFFALCKRKNHLSDQMRWLGARGCHALFRAGTKELEKRKKKQTKKEGRKKGELLLFFYCGAPLFFFSSSLQPHNRFFIFFLFLSFSLVGSFSPLKKTWPRRSSFARRRHRLQLRLSRGAALSLPLHPPTGRAPRGLRSLRPSLRRRRRRRCR